MNNYGDTRQTEAALIPKGTIINGNIEITGKLDMYGTMNGDIQSTDKVNIYGSNIKNINTVWELADEAGYLCNAAYLSGTDWSDVATTIPYYGYGYSIVLIPLFFYAKMVYNLLEELFV